MRELFRRQPKFRPGEAASGRNQVPDDLWRKCPGCGELIYNREVERSLYVCPNCHFHFRLTASQRIQFLGDEDSFEVWDADLRTADPLQFTVGTETYLDKARKTAQKAEVNESVVSGKLAIEGHWIAIVVTDFAFMGASMGSVYGEKLVRACDRALDQRMPLLTVSSSGGARMQEGMLALMQMAKTSVALTRLGAARIPHISLMVDPCYGGVTASYAAIADIVMAEPGAKIGLTGPRVIEQVTRQKLPEGFQTAEFLHEHGLIDMVVDREGLRSRLALLVDLYSDVGRSNHQVLLAATGNLSSNGARDE